MNAGRCVRVAAAVVLLVVGLVLAGSVWRHLDRGPPRLEESSPLPTAADVGAADRDLEALQGTVRAIARQRLTAGVSLALIEHGRIVWATGLGLADVEARRPATADTVYRVGSLSKSTLALAMASLEHDGVLDLDAPVRGVVRDVEFENAWEASDPIRLTELLQHTAGFDEMRFNEMFATRDQLEWTTAQVLALNPRSRRARWRPGTRHAYSHPGYTLAGHAIETVTGRPFDAVVRERVFEPLGMRVASFRPTPAVEAELATPYTGDGLARREQWFLHHRPGSHLYASAREMGRVVELLAGRGVVDGRRVAPQRVIERLEHGSTLPSCDLVPSYGLGLYAVQNDGVIWYAHGGWIPGYHSALGYLPSLGAGYVLMTNEEWDLGAVWQIESRLVAYLQRRAEPAAPLPRVELEPADLEALAGSWASRSHEVEFTRAFELDPPARVEVDGNDLRIRDADGRTKSLVHVGDHRFRRSDQTHASVLFTISADGEPVLYDANGFAYHERIPTALALGFRILLGFTLAALGLGVLWPTIWVPSGLAGRCSVALRAWPCAGAWCVYLFVDTLYETPIPALGTLNLRTAALFALSWGIPICAAASVLTCGVALLHRRDRLAARFVALLTTLGLVLATLHFARHGVIAVRTWLW
jgi:CubicO group peptidase (beta-lactamase class C family)